MADDELRMNRVTLAEVGESSRVAGLVAVLRRRLGAELVQQTSHLWPLVMLSVLIVLGQAILIASHPAITGSSDSDEYLAVAHNILSHARFADPLRTPGYPLLLALVFLLRGGQDLVAVVVVQIGLTIAAAYELYLLAFRLSKRPWLACLAAALVGANILVLDWEFSIRGETLAYWTLVTVFLVAERLLGKLRWGTLLAFAALLFFAIMVRPFDVLLPALLSGALILRGIWLGQAREHLLRLGVVLLLVYGCTYGYIRLNGAVTGYYGLSDASNVNIYGKVVEYRLQDLPVSPQLTSIQRDTAQFVRDQGPGDWNIRGQPWIAVHKYGYTGNFYALPAEYGRYVALHYPTRYLPLTLREIAADWLEGPPIYAPWQQWLLSRAVYALSRLVFEARLLLPVFAILLALRLRRDPNDRMSFMLLLMVAAVGLAIVAGAVGCYDEAPRLRFPIDWAVIVVTCLAVPHVVIPFTRDWLTRLGWKF